LKDRFRHLKPLHGVVAVVTVMVLVLGSASFAFAFDSGGTPAATGPDTIAWTGHGAADGVLNTTTCEAGNPTPDDPANTPYLHWILTTDGGSASGAPPAEVPVLKLGGTGNGTYDADKASGSAFHFITPYFTPDGDLTANADFNVDKTGNGAWNLNISHGCSGLKPLEASKTAEASYTRTYGWTITKDADPMEHSGDAGATFQSKYDVVVDQTITDSDFAVVGEITVSNPAGNPSASFSVSDSVDGTPASVSCLANTLAGGASTTCSYSVALSSATNGANTATIDSTTPGIDTTASAPYTFGEPNIDGSPTVNVTDTNGALPDGGLASDDHTFEYLKHFACPTDAALYADGKYSFDVPNRATISETGDYADANVKVNCTLPALQVTKTAAGTFNRDISWQLTKSANPTTFNGIAGQTFNPTDLWDVNATKTEADSGYKVEGDITITNPAAIPQSFNVVDVLNTNNTAGNVDCDSANAGNQASGTVPVGASVTCKYTASPGDASATQNTATVSATGNADQTADAPVSFSPNVHGDNATTLGDARFNFSQGIISTTEQKFSDSFACDANNSSKYVNDKYSFDVKNTATLKGGNTDLSAYAKVTVNCTRTRVPGEGTMGFWQNKNGQDLIKTGTSPSGPVPAVPCATAVSQLRAYNPFLDLSSTATCTQLQTYVTNVIKAANASGSSMNAMLKAQMLTTALDVTYGKVSGGANVDLTAIPKPVTSSTYENTSSAFGGGTCQPVSALLSYANTVLSGTPVSNSGGSIWYGQVKATQELAKDTFDAINNHAVFACV
jgi:hypothetical protein